MHSFQAITTKAQYFTCNRNKRSSSSSRCDGESGYYLNPKEKCQTSYNVFGHLPTLNPEGWSVLCVKPGRLSDIFDISKELRDVTTMFVDNSLK